MIFLETNFNDIKANGNPKEFDYARYLRIHNVTEQAYIKTDQWVRVGNDANPVLSWIFDLRQSLNNTLQNSGMSPKNAMVANALLLGQKECLDKDVLRSYSSAGAMHVLAVSGLHVGIIMLILTSLLSPVKRIRKGQTLFIVLVLMGIWFYAIITGLSPSVMRAAVMFSFIVIGKELQRDTTIYQSIMVSAFLLILLEPYIIFQVGFQLSYLAVLGIVFLQPKIENLLYIKNKILFKAWQISAVSIAAQIATFPLGLYYFHQFPNFFLLSNLIVIPLAFCILIVGISYLCLHVIPYISDLLLWILDGMISILNWGVEFVQTLPLSIMWGISIEWYEVVLIYLTLLLASVGFIYRKSSSIVASMVMCVVLLVFNIWEKSCLTNENVFCIYNVNDELAIDVFYGRQNVFYSTSEFIEDEEKLLFHVKHHWFYRTGEEEPTKWVDNSSLDYLIFERLKFGFLSDRNHSTFQKSTPVLDYVVLSDINYIDKDVLDVFESQRTSIIFANDVGYQLKNFVRKSYHISIHDLKDDGAFLITKN